MKANRGRGAVPCPRRRVFGLIGGRRAARRASCLALALAVGIMPALGGCTPTNSAVGDTRNQSTNVTHDSIDRTDLLMGVVAAGDATLDQQVIESFSSSGVKAVYMPAGQAEAPVQTAQESFTSLTHRKVSAIIVDGMNADEQALTQPNGQGGTSTDSKKASKFAGAFGWSKPLQEAREAGIPVILIDPVRAPKNSKLYAVILNVNDDADNGAKDDSVTAHTDGDPSSNTVRPFEEAVALVVNDNPHPKTMTVTLKVKSNGKTQQ
ncbi:hypothetical protein [Bifidobacterium sp. ESL0790]|uniref:hypothetical protein n=1 Tax=Bifidobacterium sp. ESL0790 TaxID=2983233 RepID=UPI0023F68843|nr:hypothetical protein [Bifidobacterium sp. ESL0790]WEV72910.1 hypothetical protein OZY47_02845 [Bifidobacterium sp. ESL0790]